MKIYELLEGKDRPMPKTDLRVGDHVTADTSKEQYPGGHKSRSGKVTRVGQTGVHIQPDDGGEREYHPYKIVKKTESMAEGHADQERKIFKKNGKPVGEVGIDRESSPGNGQWYMKCYAYNIDNAGYDSYEEAVAELKHCLKQGVEESATAGATSSASIGTVVNPHLSPGAARGKKSYTGSPGQSGTKAPPQPKPKAQKPTDNALNMKGTSIFGGPAIKR